MKHYLWAALVAVLWPGCGMAKPVTPVLDGVLPFVGVRHLIPPEAALAYPPTLQRPYATVLSDRIGVHRQWRYQPDLYGPLFEVQVDLAGLVLPQSRALAATDSVPPRALAALLAAAPRPGAGLGRLVGPGAVDAGRGSGGGGGGGSGGGQPVIAPVPLPAAGGLALGALAALGLGAARRRPKAPNAGNWR